MVQDLSKLEMLAAALVRKRQPNAQPSDIAAAIDALRQRIDRGELTFDVVVCRLQREVDDCRNSAPTAFGDVARACRDLDGGRLTARERSFVKEMVALGFNSRPSQRQIDWLNAIFALLQRRAA